MNSLHEEILPLDLEYQSKYSNYKTILTPYLFSHSGIDLGITGYLIGGQIIMEPVVLALLIVAPR